MLEDDDKNSVPVYKKRRNGEFIPAPNSPTCDELLLRPPDVVEKLDLENFEIPLPPGQTLLKFQPPAIKQMLGFMKHQGMKGVYNGYDQGLGKTIMAIAMANVLKRKRILVITTSGTRDNWESEIRNYSTIDPLTVRTLYNSRNAMTPIYAAWCVCSYHLLLRKNVYEAIVAQPWDFMILDEAKEISNPTAKRTIICRDLWRRIRYGKLMSGTPLSRCAIELFVPCNMLMPHEFHDYDLFAEEYCETRSVPWGQGWEYFGGKNLDKLSKTIRANFFVRRMKDEVLPDLPKKTYQRIIFEVEKLSYRETVDEKREMLDAIERGENPQKNTKKYPHISKKRIETALALIKEGKNHVAEYLDAGIPVIVVTYHHVVTDALMECFKKYNPVRLDGSVIGEKKAKVVKAFNEGRMDLMFLQIESAVGINLQVRCWTMFFWEWSYDPNEANQALDRVCRYGQKQHVNGFFMVVKDSTDEQVFKIVFGKQRMINKVIKSN